MDCPSEENLIRMKLDGQAIQKLDFDIPNRRLSVYHEDNIQPIDEALKDLKLGSLLENTIEAEIQNTQTDHRKEKQLLWSVLLINFGFFVGVFKNSFSLVLSSFSRRQSSFIHRPFSFIIFGAESFKRSKSLLFLLLSSRIVND